MPKDNKERICIAFDAQPLLSGTKSGVGFHEDGLVKTMINQQSDYCFQFDYFSWKNREQKQEIIKKYVDEKYVKVKECRWFPGTIYRMLWGFFPLPYSIFFGKKAKLTHFFNFCIPPGVCGKKVVTIHDMTIHRYPETVRWKTKIMLKLNLKRSIKRADAIIAVSEFTKQEIQKFYEINQDKIYVVPNGVDRTVFHDNYSKERIEQAKLKYGITGEYFIYVGTIEPRKNLVRLVEAYSLAKEKKGNDFPKLVISGAKGWLCEEIYNISDLHKNCIIFTGYLENEDVPVLICGAKVFCFPSLYEGFGMPVLEAMACGTPVLTSNNSAMEEIVGDSAITINPFNVMEISEALITLHEDETLRKCCKQKGLLQSQKYSWESATQKLLTVYENVLKNKRK